MPIAARDYQPLAEENEGNIPWMYLDTRGNVTVGIGHKLDTAAEAVALPFIDRVTGRPASREQVRSAYVTVRDAGHLATRGAGAFDELTALRLPQAAIRAEYERNFAEVVGQTRTVFRETGGGFDSYPDPAQLAVIDMAFNLGARGLYAQFVVFRENGLDRRDFEVAARESRRTGIAESRNIKTRSLLLEAARVEHRHR